MVFHTSKKPFIKTIQHNTVFVSHLHSLSPSLFPSCLLSHFVHSSHQAPTMSQPADRCVVARNVGTKVAQWVTHEAHTPSG